MSSPASVYGTSALNGHRRYRRTNAELAEIDDNLLEIAEAERPVTVSGLFYRMVSRGLVPKTDKGPGNGYGVVQRETLKLRRSGAMPYGWITDGSRRRLKPRSFSSAQAALQNTATMYRRALWNDQGVHVEIWAEKDAITGVVYLVTAEFDVPLFPARGYSSETFLYETAEEINEDGKPAVIYQLGDHDPSGVDAWRHIRNVLRGHVDYDIDLTFERIAVTPQQIADMSLPTRPTKQSDSRAANFIGESVEVDAIPSSALRDLVREAIERWIDPEALSITRIAEDSEREILRRIAGELEGGRR